MAADCSRYSYLAGEYEKSDGYHVDFVWKWVSYSAEHNVHFYMSA